MAVFLCPGNGKNMLLLNIKKIYSKNKIDTGKGLTLSCEYCTMLKEIRREYSLIVQSMGGSKSVYERIRQNKIFIRRKLIR